MAQRPNVLCAGGCGNMLWSGVKSAGPGKQTCQPCRRVRNGLAPGEPARERLCEEVGCEELHLARGLCSSHYRKTRRALGEEVDLRVGRVGGNSARRARHYGAAYEWVDRVSIFDRDGWVCGLCAEPVDPTLSYPDPQSASVDHIVPLVRGGGHVAANTQCSHLACNWAKGAREEASRGLAV